MTTSPTPEALVRFDGEHAIVGGECVTCRPDKIVDVLAAAEERGVARERERCAGIADAESQRHVRHADSGDMSSRGASIAAENIAATIRRGTP